MFPVLVRRRRKAQKYFEFAVFNQLEFESFKSVRSRGGGVTTIYEGTKVRGVPFLGVPFFQQKINFGVSFLVK